MYQERITQVDAKLGEVKLGRAHEYLQPLEQLQENMRIRTEVAGILRNYRMANVRNKFQAEEAAAMQNYQVRPFFLSGSYYNNIIFGSKFVNNVYFLSNISYLVFATE